METSFIYLSVCSLSASLYCVIGLFGVTQYHCM